MLTDKAKQMIADRPIGFAEMHPPNTVSPDTVGNIRGRSRVAVGVIDILMRQGMAAAGTARTVARKADEDTELSPRFGPVWGGEFEKTSNAIVVTDIDIVTGIEHCREIDGPAYDVGAPAAAVRDDDKARIANLYKRRKPDTAVAA